MARGKKTNQLADSKEYALRNKKGVKMFIPNVINIFGKNKPAKTKIIKKHPKDKPLKDKKGLKKEVKVKFPSVEKKKQKTRKIRTLIHLKINKGNK
jgi:capsule polysaccharide modification protein KpsS